MDDGGLMWFQTVGIGEIDEEEYESIYPIDKQFNEFVNSHERENEQDRDIECAQAPF